MTAEPAIPVSRVEWVGAVRIIRSVFPPIDLFEDIADPADWPLLISAEQKTNPRIAATIGNLDLVPPERRVGGNGASWLMAPFTHVSVDRPSRFTNGSYGVLYVGIGFETALFETIHHHGCFMLRTREAPGWTSQFREIVLSVNADLHDLRAQAPELAPALDPAQYAAAQALGANLKVADRTASSIPACDMRAASAPRCSIRIVLRTLCRAATWIITGTARVWISSGMQGLALCFGWSTCRPTSPEL